MKLSIIIVNFNVKYFLEHCLYSVSKACSNIEAEIFVVDNASTDESFEYFQGKFPQVNFRWNQENVGFSKANNSVLAETKGDYILFLNPDTIVAEDSFEKCLDYISTHHDCSGLGVHMIDGAGNFLKESKRSFPTLASSFYKLMGLSRFFPTSKTFSSYYASHVPENKIASVEVLSGAFFMITRKILSRVKGFDEDFFMYGEDIDLSFRIKKTGFKNIYFPDTTILHFKGESTQKLQADYITQFYGAMKLFVKKHHKENKMLLRCINIAIGVTAFFAERKRRIQTITPTRNKMHQPASILIVGSNDSFNEMIHVIKHAPTPMVIFGRVAVDEFDTDFAACSLDNFANFISKNNIKNVLFCEKDISYAQIFDVMKTHKNVATFHIHTNGCLTTISSGSAIVF